MPRLLAVMALVPLLAAGVSQAAPAPFLKRPTAPARPAVIGPGLYRLLCGRKDRLLRLNADGTFSAHGGEDGTFDFDGRWSFTRGFRPGGEAFLLLDARAPIIVRRLAFNLDTGVFLRGGGEPFTLRRLPEAGAAPR